MTAGFSQWTVRRMDEIFMASWAQTPLAAKLVSAILIVLLGFIAARLVGRLAYLTLRAILLNQLIAKTGIAIRAEQGMARALEVVAYAMSIILALSILGLGKLTGYMLIAIALVLAITSLLGFLISLSSITSGLSLRKKLKQGMRIRISRAAGEVESIHLTYTIIKGRNGEQIYLPNSLVRLAEIES
jgi:small-conductance mechanosensitive channel